MTDLPVPSGPTPDPDEPLQPMQPTMNLLDGAITAPGFTMSGTPAVSTRVHGIVDARARISRAIVSAGYQVKHLDLRHGPLWIGWILDATIIDPSGAPYETTTGFSREYGVQRETLTLRRMVADIERDYCGRRPA